MKPIDKLVDLFHQLQLLLIYGTLSLFQALKSTILYQLNHSLFKIACHHCPKLILLLLIDEIH